MGLILDSSIIVAHERRGDSVAQILRHIASVSGNEHVALSAIGLTELAHAIYRAQAPARRERREKFINDLLTDMEIVPYTKTTALLAGRVDGEQRRIGITIPTADLLIGITALELRYTIATINPRHFNMIPGLNITLP